VEGKGGARSITKEICKMVSIPVRYTIALDYIVYKESGMDKIRITAGCRAVTLKEKALKRSNKRLLIECIKVRERERDSK